MNVKMIHINFNEKNLAYNMNDIHIYINLFCIIKLN